MRAVFNSSPLIFLSKLNIIDHTPKLFSEVTIPDYVQKEILRKEDKASRKLKALLRSNNVNVVEVKNFRMVEALHKKLGRGECEAIVVAVEQSADFVILDDTVARAEAKRMGLNVKGTLGIIRRLMELDIIQYDLHKLYWDLEFSIQGFHFEGRLIDKRELETRTKEFSLKTIEFVAKLPKNRVTDVLGYQLLKAGTSIGANYLPC